ncbi:MAG: PAS-domain containing protein [Pseudomonadota bacterium]
MIEDVNDIDAQRIQEFLKITFESMDQGITIYDGDFKLVAWNDRYAAMGITPRKHLQYGANLLNLYLDFAKEGIFGPGDPEELAAQRVQAMRDGPLIKNELLTPPTGRTIRIRRFRLPNGGVCATFNDVTEEMQVEVQLRQSQKMDAIGKLTGGVAHDFNNVLAIITGSLELIIDKSKDETIARIAREALETSDRGARLTHRLLAFARQQPLEPKIINPGALFTGLLDMLRQLLGEPIDVELVCDAGLWLCEVDPNQLEHVVINLVVNARDSMPDGGKLTIEASNARVDDDYAETVEISPGQYVCLAVTDTGYGMEQKVIETAFDPFFTTKQAGHGTGLGLSMAHGFVKQSGGHIKIYSEVNQGTTVKIYLPRAGGHQIDLIDQTPVRDEVSTGRKVILVVEDDNKLRSVVVSQIESLGYETLEAADGAEGLAVIEKNGRVDLLLTDVVLPGGMSGRELSTRVNEAHPDIPVVFMSGYTENSIIHHGRLDSDVVLLQKPFRKADLSRTLRRVLYQD